MSCWVKCHFLTLANSVLSVKSSLFLRAESNQVKRIPTVDMRACQIRAFFVPELLPLNSQVQHLIAAIFG